MCKGKTNCTCCRHDGPRLKLQLASSEVRAVRYQGRDHIVVPVIMAQDDVVMNDYLYPSEEFHPESWNGVPVTVQHPSKNGTHVTANDPQTLEEYSIGRIFNARNEDGKLKAEAWIDVKVANQIAPGLVDSLLQGEPLDVSTGFFSDTEATTGEVQGRKYDGIHRNVRPDHLAFLPGVQGACSWADGCGVRSNSMKIFINEKAEAAYKAMLDAFESLKAMVTNARSSTDDYRQQIADLVSSDASPFTAEDMSSMSGLSSDTLKRLHDQYCSDMSSNAATTETEMKPEEIAALVKETVTASVAEALKTFAAPQLSAEDKAALTSAKAIVAEKREKLIADVVANSKMTKEQAAAMPDATLEVFLAALPKAPVPTYMGRAMPVGNADDPVAKDMATTGVVAAFKARGAKKKEAA